MTASVSVSGASPSPQVLQELPVGTLVVVDLDHEAASPLEALQAFREKPELGEARLVGDEDGVPPPKVQGAHHPLPGPL
jgi:hypothetical protein